MVFDVAAFILLKAKFEEIAIKIVVADFEKIVIFCLIKDRNAQTFNIQNRSNLFANTTTIPNPPPLNHKIYTFKKTKLLTCLHEMYKIYDI